MSYKSAGTRQPVKLVDGTAENNGIIVFDRRSVSDKPDIHIESLRAQVLTYLICNLGSGTVYGVISNKVLGRPLCNLGPAYLILGLFVISCFGLRISLSSCIVYPASSILLSLLPYLPAARREARNGGSPAACIFSWARLIS